MAGRYTQSFQPANPKITVPGTRDPHYPTMSLVKYTTVRMHLLGLSKHVHNDNAKEQSNIILCDFIVIYLLFYLFSYINQELLLQIVKFLQTDSSGWMDVLFMQTPTSFRT